MIAELPIDVADDRRAPRERRGGRDRRKANRDEQGRRLLPNGNPDPDPSCYSVTRVGEGQFEIRHYLDPDDKKPCCAMRIERSARDIEAARAEGVHVDIVTLRRAPECVNKKRATT